MDGDEQELWEWYRRGGRRSDREALFDRYRRPVGNSLAWRKYQWAGRASGLDYAEFQGAAWLAIWLAIPNVDPDKSKPSSYLAIRVSGALADLLRDSDPFTRVQRRRANHASRTRDILTQQLGREPNLHQYDPEELPVMCNFSDLAFEQSEDNRDYSPEQQIDKGAPALASSASGYQDLAPYLRGLSGRERLFVVLEFVEGYSAAESARQLGFSASRWSQMRSDVMARVATNAAAWIERDPEASRFYSRSA